MACSWTRNSCVGRVLKPEGGESAASVLRIGQRAALAPTPGAKVYGLVFSLTRSELDRLYSESSVQAYKPQAVLAQAEASSPPFATTFDSPVAYRTQSRIRREVACRLAEGWTPGRVHRNRFSSASWAVQNT
jgi:hypothetical protein